MKTVQIEFSKYESVNFLWSELIEDYGFDKARKLVFLNFISQPFDPR